MAFDTVIPTSKRIERLRYENPWWVTGAVQEVYQNMSRRLYFDLFYPFVKETAVKRAVVLMGPRRVGKTVMLYHSIHALLEEGVPRKNIFFIGIDNPIYMHLGLEEVVLLAQEAVQLNHLEGCFVFFDEIYKAQKVVLVGLQILCCHRSPFTSIFTSKV